ncbi:hypothetical protein D9757_000919 [Collybiopsis confluens]|uniref:Fungal-type protein kinase domain-containing protein n=1 Tax=Collybiopsis confluens TaxID=2823264 RepID=A0A8H5HZX3_9AGAR|nr:hypothetical protein D9757_000919 [Collybiopsis confluens]
MTNAAHVAVPIRATSIIMSATPENNTIPLLHETPAHARLSSTYPFTSTTQDVNSVFAVAAEDMKEKYFGPIQVSEFLKYYLPKHAQTPPLPDINYAAFRRVASQPAEPHMYEPLISALEPFCKGITLLNSSTHEDSHPPTFHGHHSKPDISIYDDSNKPPSSNPTDSSRMLGFMELKNDTADEPFADDGPFERDTLRPRHTRGQIAVYSTSIAASQYRTRIFSVFINRSLCRIMCATRSGTTVTRSFNYTKSTHLATFFWHLSHSSAEARGIDTTFSRMFKDDAELEAARSALGLKATVVVHRVSVVDEVTKATSFFIVSEPFTRAHTSPTGRCSRCFVAYDVARKKVVVLKDHWRVSGYDAEGITYRALNAQLVPNIPTLVTAGDVNEGVPGWQCGDEVFLKLYRPRVYHHYRLVLDTVGRSLTEFESTWQLVTAIMDAMDAHQVAFKRCSRLHRDVSVGNILITDKGRGMLIDWELSKDVKQTGARTYEKTGTWQFKSMRLIQANNDYTVTNSIADDIESFLWVLSWVVARNAPSKMADAACAGFLQVFDLHPLSTVTKLDKLFGGAVTIKALQLETAQVSRLLLTLWRQFGARYGSEYFLMKKEDKSPEFSEEWLRTLDSHDWMIEQLRTALSDEKWEKLNDPRIDRKLPQTSKCLTAGQKKRRSAVSNDLPATLSKRFRTDVPPREPSVESGTPLKPRAWTAISQT